MHTPSAQKPAAGDMRTVETRHERLSRLQSTESTSWLSTHVCLYLLSLCCFTVSVAGSTVMANVSSSAQPVVQTLDPHVLDHSNTR